MILEFNNKKEIKNEFKNIEKKILLLLITFSINLLLFNDSPILFTTPFLVLLNIKLSIRLLLSSDIGDLLGRYIFEIGIRDEISFYPLIFSLISLVLSVLLLEISLNLINEEKRQYSHRVIFYILCIFSFSLLGLDFYIYDLSTLIIILSLFYLLSNKIIDFNIYFSFIFINIILIYFFK